jgi:hypothetical protein
MRGKTPEALVGLARDRPTGRTENQNVSEVQTARLPRGGARTNGRGRRGAPPRGGAGNTSRRGRSERGKLLERTRDGAGNRRASASRVCLQAGLLPDGDVRGTIVRARQRTVGSRPHGRSEDLAKRVARCLALEGVRDRVRPDLGRRRAHRIRGLPEHALEGTKPRRAPTT